MQNVHKLEDAGEARGSPRTNLFLAAVLQGASFSFPVKIRNMSVQGALIEAPILPSSGSEACLVRGRLAVSCVVAWKADGRCGLKLSSAISVREWLLPPGNTQQQRVDATVRSVKEQGLCSQSSAGIATDLARSEVTYSQAQLAEDLRRAVSLIETVGDNLASDDLTIARHGAILQLIDIAVQTIAAAADTLASGAR